VIHLNILSSLSSYQVADFKIILLIFWNRNQHWIMLPKYYHCQKSCQDSYKNCSVLQDTQNFCKICKILQESCVILSKSLAQSCTKLAEFCTKYIFYPVHRGARPLNEFSSCRMKLIDKTLTRLLQDSCKNLKNLVKIFEQVATKHGKVKLYTVGRHKHITSNKVIKSMQITACESSCTNYY
jgi:hypothetical protein